MNPNHQERLMTVIVGPHISEKSTIIAEENNQIVFKVRKDANKKDIKQAVEHLFEVSVENVSTINYQGKRKGKGNLTWKTVDNEDNLGQDEDSNDSNNHRKGDY